MRNRIIIGGAVAVFIISLGVVARAQPKDKKEVSSEDFAEVVKKAVESMDYAKISASYVCPRYFLRYSMALFDIGDVDSAIKIAEVAKNILRLDEKALSNYETVIDTRYIKELNDPQLKKKMLMYVKSLEKATEAHLEYFKSKDRKKIDEIDTYLNESSKYDQEISDMTKEKILTGTEAVGAAISLCPRWLTTLAESYMDYALDDVFQERGYRKDIVPCKDCAEINMMARDVIEVASKNFSLDDKVLQGKYLSYFEALKNFCGCNIMMYDLVGSNSLDALKNKFQNLSQDQMKKYKELCPDEKGESYQDRAIAIWKEIVEYQLSKNSR